MDSVLCCYCIHQDYEVTTEAHTRTAGLDFFGTPTLVIEKDRKKKKKGQPVLHSSSIILFPLWYWELGAYNIIFSLARQFI